MVDNNFNDDVKEFIKTVKSLQRPCMVAGLQLEGDRMIKALSLRPPPYGESLQESCYSIVFKYTDSEGLRKVEKSIPIEKFNKDSLWLWRSLIPLGAAPRLYYVGIDGNSVKYEMEEIKGKISDIPDEFWAEENDDVRASFSLIFLRDILEKWKKMNQLGYTHNDLHDLNIMLSMNMEVIFIDFETASKSEDEGIQDDIEQIMRIFTFIHSGVRNYNPETVKTASKLEEIDQELKDCTPEKYQVDLLRVMKELSCVSNQNEVANVKSLVNNILSHKKMEGEDYIKRAANIIIFKGYDLREKTNKKKEAETNNVMPIALKKKKNDSSLQSELMEEVEHLSSKELPPNAGLVEPLEKRGVYSLKDLEDILDEESARQLIKTVDEQAKDRLKQRSKDHRGEYVNNEEGKLSEASGTAQDQALEDVTKLIENQNFTRSTDANSYAERRIRPSITETESTEEDHPL